MKRRGPTFVPALAALAIGGATLFLSKVLWLQLPASILLLIGVALGVGAIATPDFLEADDGDDE